MSALRAASALAALAFTVWVLITGITSEYAPGTLTGLAIGIAWLHFSLTSSNDKEESWD